MATQLTTWRALALCAGTDPAAFYSETPKAIAVAKAVCEECPVRDECREHAIETHEPFGVWGGLSADDRARLSGPIRRGPDPSVNDADLVELFAVTNPMALARVALESAHEISRQTAYKYLRRARDLGLVELRFGSFYPRR
jgi:WhiB family transcriptional regulator, redox-sensing transcriptional regulator